MTKRFIWSLFSLILLSQVPAMGQGKALEFDPAPSGSVFVVPIEGMIDNGLARYISRAVKDAEENGAGIIIFDIDTFGGLVDAADEIRKSILNANVPTVAFIDKNAASAGALISYAADRIVMVPGASIGAATVVEALVAKQHRTSIRATCAASCVQPLKPTAEIRVLPKPW